MTEPSVSAATWTRIKRRRFVRLLLVWQVLRGRPVAYRVEIRGGTLVLRHGAMAVQCTVLDATVATEADSERPLNGGSGA